MKFTEYIALADQDLLAGSLFFDYAVSAEKMCRWDYLGDDNAAWGEGPYLASGANCPPIPHDYPYLIRSSIYNSMAAKMALGMNPPKSENGGVLIPHGPYDTIATEGFTARSLIIFQHTLLENYELSRYKIWLGTHISRLDSDKFTLKDIEEKGIQRIKDGRIEHHLKRYSSNSPRKRLEEALKTQLDSDDMLKMAIDKYASLSDRRNEFVHDIHANKATMKEAIEFSFATRRIGKQIGDAMGDHEATSWKFPDDI